MRKKVDERIRTLIENGVKLRHRSMFVIIGDKSRDQVRYLSSLHWTHIPYNFGFLDINCTILFLSVCVTSLTDSEPPSYAVKGNH